MQIQKRGFTMIELMVVIAIIGLLASIVMVSLGSGRVKARDAKRVDALRTIASALDVYFQEQGHYPISAAWANDCTNTNGNNWIPNTGDTDPYAWSSTLISDMPRDPSRACPSVTPFSPDNRASTEYAYRSIDAAGSGYELMARLEDANSPKNIQNDHTKNCSGGEYYTDDGYNARAYAVNSCSY